MPRGFAPLARTVPAHGGPLDAPAPAPAPAVVRCIFAIVLGDAVQRSGRSGRSGLAWVGSGKWNLELDRDVR